MECGIYKIENKINKKCYIGQSINIENRWKEHIKMLNSNKHHSAKLQNSWDKHSNENFEFSVIEICDKLELNLYEYYYMDIYDSIKNGYNIKGISCEIGSIKSDSMNSKYLNKFENSIINFIKLTYKLDDVSNNVKCIPYRYSSLNLYNNYKTPLRFIKSLKMIIDMINLIENKSKDIGIYFSYINYLNKDKGTFEYKILENVEGKWYLDGKRNYNHKVWMHEFKNIISDYIRALYFQKQNKYLLFYFYNAVKYLNVNIDKHIIKFIEKGYNENFINSILNEHSNITQTDTLKNKKE